MCQTKEENASNRSETSQKDDQNRMLEDCYHFLDENK